MKKDFMSNKNYDESQIVVTQYVLENLREAKSGKYKAYHNLGRIYKNGLGVKKDAKKAALYFEECYKGFRSDNRINEVDILIDLGNLYMVIKENKKAFECFLKAGIELQKYGKTQKSKNLLLKEYKIEKLIKDTGVSDLS